MRFEHLVQVNDFMNPLIEPLSRGELWEGLVRSIEEPALYLEGLDAMVVRSRAPGRMERELRFGAVVILDRVTLVAGERIEIVADGTALHPEARRTISLEEKPPGDLYLRFTYEIRPQGHAPWSDQDFALVKQAWLRADLDLAGKVRALCGKR